MKNLLAVALVCASLTGLMPADKDAPQLAQTMEKKTQNDYILLTQHTIESSPMVEGGGDLLGAPIPAETGEFDTFEAPAPAPAPIAQGSQVVQNFNPPGISYGASAGQTVNYGQPQYGAPVSTGRRSVGAAMQTGVTQQQRCQTVSVPQYSAPVYEEVKIPVQTPVQSTVMETQNYQVQVPVTTMRTETRQRQVPKTVTTMQTSYRTERRHVGNQPVSAPAMSAPVQDCGCGPAPSPVSAPMQIMRAPQPAPQIIMQQPQVLATPVATPQVCAPCSAPAIATPYATQVVQGPVSDFIDSKTGGRFSKLLCGFRKRRLARLQKRLESCTNSPGA